MHLPVVPTRVVTVRTWSRIVSSGRWGVGRWVVLLLLLRRRRWRLMEMLHRSRGRGLVVGWTGMVPLRGRRVLLLNEWWLRLLLLESGVVRLLLLLHEWSVPLSHAISRGMWGRWRSVLIMVRMRVLGLLDRYDRRWGRTTWTRLSSKVRLIRWRRTAITTRAWTATMVLLRGRSRWGRSVRRIVGTARWGIRGRLRRDWRAILLLLLIVHLLWRSHSSLAAVVCGHGHVHGLTRPVTDRIGRMLRAVAVIDGTGRNRVETDTSNRHFE